MDDARTNGTLADEDIRTVMGGDLRVRARTQDEDGTDNRDADGTDAQDADSTDAQDTDSTDQ